MNEKELISTAGEQIGNVIARMCAKQMKVEKRYKRIIKRCKHYFFVGIRNVKEKGIGVTIQEGKRALGIRGKANNLQFVKVPFYSKAQLEEQKRDLVNSNVKISIITPLHNTEESLLIDMIESVFSQTYSNWELCMADASDKDHDYVQRVCQEYADKDARINYKKLEKDAGTAENSNSCVNMATGDYIAMLAHDDILHPAALHDIIKAICEEGADFVYTDEAFFKLNQHELTAVNFKPDYAPDSLLATNYISHFVAVKRSLLDRCGYFRSCFEGSQHHELILRLTDTAEKVFHIPKVLYYRRLHKGSGSDTCENRAHALESGKRAVECFLKEKGITATVSTPADGKKVYRIKYELPSEHPLVSIIIPNCDHVDDLRTCISSIQERTTYRNYEIVVCENNSKEPALFEYYDEIQRESNVNVIIWPGTGFNWAAINNYAIRNSAKGDYILLMNNDTEVISPDWIQEMLMYAQRNDVGLVGAMLYYPDDTVQHAGVILGVRETAGHGFVGVRRGRAGYMGRLLYAQNLSAVTGACMMMRRSVYEEMNGIDEIFAVDLNDIDYCMRIRKAGYLIVWTPFCELYHAESKSRGFAVSREERARSKREKQLFLSRWEGEIAKGDPYYNPNLSLVDHTFSLNKEELKKRKKANQRKRVTKK